MLRVLSLGLALLAIAARGNTLTNADVQPVRDFIEKAGDLSSAILATEGASLGFTRGCLISLESDLQEVQAEIGSVKDLVDLDVLMVDPQDEASVIGKLRIEAQSLLNSLAVHRTYINATMGNCASSRVVATKGQEILRLYDEAGALVWAISRPGR